jgi:hypothetical protein
LGRIADEKNSCFELATFVAGLGERAGALRELDRWSDEAKELSRD